MKDTIKSKEEEEAIVNNVYKKRIEDIKRSLEHFKATTPNYNKELKVLELLVKNYKGK